MATPHVAALAALLVADARSLTPDWVAQLIQQSASELGAPGADALTGAGLIDVSGAIGMPSPAVLKLVVSGPGVIRSQAAAGQEPGGAVVLTAVPYPGALFTGWAVDGTERGWENP